MSLVYRVKRLVKSDMHALVEGLEDPRWVLAQALRDMEEELEKIESDLSVRHSQISKLKDRIIGTEAILSALENDIEFAMQEKREEIAKNLIRKQLLSRKNLQDLQEKGKVSEEEIQKVEEDYRLKKGAYEDIRGRCEVMNLTRVNDDVFQAAVRLVTPDGGVDSTLNHQVELEFLKRLQKQRGDHEVQA